MNKTRWEQLEAWLFDNDERPFNSKELAASLGVSGHEASDMISSYLQAQRGASTNTLYVLKREHGRTSAAVWSVGHRTADARVVGEMLFDDVKAKVLRAYRPDLKRIAEKNPRAARYAEAKIEAVVNGALVMLASAVDVIIGDDDDDEDGELAA